MDTGHEEQQQPIDPFVRGLEGLRQVDRWADEGAVDRPTLEWAALGAADLFQEGIGARVEAVLLARGFTEEQIAALPPEEINKLVPDLLEDVAAIIARLGPVACSALETVTYDTEREAGLTNND